MCLDKGLDGWWCVEKRVARTLRVFLSKNPFPATARPTGPNVAVGARTYSLVRILQLFSAHRIHVQPSHIVHSHCFCILGCPFDVPMEAHQSSNKEGVCFIEQYNKVPLMMCSQWECTNTIFVKTISSLMVSRSTVLFARGCQGGG